MTIAQINFEARRQAEKRDRADRRKAKRDLDKAAKAFQMAIARFKSLA